VVEFATRGAQDVSPSALLKRKLEMVVAPVRTLLGSDFASQRDDTHMTLRRLTELIERRASHDDLLQMLQRPASAIDLTELLGEISWSGRFNAQDATLDVRRILEWSSRFGLSLSDAEELVDAAVDAGVFTPGAPEWADPLVADGLAALYLARQMASPEIDRPAIAEMIATLQRQNSIDILGLCLDAAVLKEWSRLRCVAL
jgi:hypothetical protein